MVRGGDDPAVDRAGAAHGGVGERAHPGAVAAAAGLLHAHRVADDRGGQHLALLLHPRLRPARAAHRARGPAEPQLARQPGDRARLPDGGDDLEGGRLLHDLLPGRAPVALAPARRGGGPDGGGPLVLLPPGDVPAPHAHHAVRAGERGDQLVPAGGPLRGDDQGRARQRHRAPPLLHLRRRLQVLGPGVRGGPHPGAARDPGRGRAGAVPAAGPAGALSMTRALETAGAWLLGVLWALPLAYAVWTAFHPAEYSTRFVPGAPLTLENFAKAWAAAPFARYFVNTTLLVAMILAVQLVLCTLAAYAFARFAFAGRAIAFLLVLVQLMIMPDVLIVENYRTMSRLGLLDTLAGIGLPYMASAFGSFLLRQTFKTVPKELDEAARVEGAGSLETLWRVYVPLARPVYIAYGLVSVSYHWNNFLWPLIVTNSVQSRPLTVGLQVFSSVDQGVDWSIITAATLMTSGPLLVAFLLFQRQFVQSFMRAGIR